MGNSESENPKASLEWKKPEEILQLSPRGLADYLADLQRVGKFEDYLEYAIENDSLIAQLSYWEKWLSKKQRERLEEVIARKKEKTPIERDSLPLNMEKKFSENELRIILSNLAVIQLSFGCSMGCLYCGFDAVPGVRDYIPFPQLENLFRKYGKQIAKSKPDLFFASEPSDYKFKDKTYKDVHRLSKKYSGYSPFISTKKSDNEEWLAYLDSMSTEKNKHRVSLFGKKDEVVESLRNKYKKLSLVGGGQEHVAGIGVSNKATSKNKKGIGCDHGVLMTPRGLYNIYQVEISKQYPQGQIVYPFEGFKGGGIKPGDSLESVLTHHLIPYEKTYEPYPPNFLKNDLNLIGIIGGDGKIKGLFFNKKLEVVNEFEPKNAELLNAINLLSEQTENMLSAYDSERSRLAFKYKHFILKTHQDRYLDMKASALGLGGGYTFYCGPMFGSKSDIPICVEDMVYRLSEDGSVLSIYNKNDELMEEVEIPGELIKMRTEFLEKFEKKELLIKERYTDMKKMILNELEFLKEKLGGMDLTLADIEMRMGKKAGEFDEVEAGKRQAGKIPMLRLYKKGENVYLLYENGSNLSFTYPGTKYAIHAPYGWAKRLSGDELARLKVVKEKVDISWNNEKKEFTLDQAKKALGDVTLGIMWPTWSDITILDD